MLVRGVIRHEIEDELHAAGVHFREQAIEIFERAERRRDVAVVGDVVAEILHRRGVDRRDPHRVDAEPREVIEALANAVEIAFAVAVAVLERKRIDLIDDAALPPQRIRGRCGSRVLSHGKSSQRVAWNRAMQQTQCHTSGGALFAASADQKESIMAQSHRRTPPDDTAKPGGPADVAAGWDGDRWHAPRDYGAQAAARGVAGARDR